MNRSRPSPLESATDHPHVRPTQISLYRHKGDIPHHTPSSYHEDETPTLFDTTNNSHEKDSASSSLLSSRNQSNWFPIKWFASSPYEANTASPRAIGSPTSERKHSSPRSTTNQSATTSNFSFKARPLPKTTYEYIPPGYGKTRLSRRKNNTGDINGRGQTTGVSQCFQKSNDGTTGAESTGAPLSDSISITTQTTELPRVEPESEVHPPDFPFTQQDKQRVDFIQNDNPGILSMDTEEKDEEPLDSRFESGATMMTEADDSLAAQMVGNNETGSIEDDGSLMLFQHDPDLNKDTVVVMILEEEEDDETEEEDKISFVTASMSIVSHDFDYSKTNNDYSSDGDLRRMLAPTTDLSRNEGQFAVAGELPNNADVAKDPCITETVLSTHVELDDSTRQRDDTAFETTNASKPFHRHLSYQRVVRYLLLAILLPYIVTLAALEHDRLMRERTHDAASGQRTTTKLDRFSMSPTTTEHVSHPLLGDRSANGATSSSPGTAQQMHVNVFRKTNRKDDDSNYNNNNISDFYGIYSQLKSHAKHFWIDLERYLFPSSFRKSSGVEDSSASGFRQMMNHGIRESYLSRINLVMDPVLDLINYVIARLHESTSQFHNLLNESHILKDVINLIERTFQAGTDTVDGIAHRLFPNGMPYSSNVSAMIRDVRDKGVNRVHNLNKYVGNTVNKLSRRYLGNDINTFIEHTYQAASDNFDGMMCILVSKSNRIYNAIFSVAQSLKKNVGSQVTIWINHVGSFVNEVCYQYVGSDASALLNQAFQTGLDVFNSVLDGLMAISKKIGKKGNELTQDLTKEVVRLRRSGSNHMSILLSKSIRVYDDVMSVVLSLARNLASRVKAWIDPVGNALNEVCYQFVGSNASTLINRAFHTCRDFVNSIIDGLFRTGDKVGNQGYDLMVSRLHSWNNRLFKKVDKLSSHYIGCDFSTLMNHAYQAGNDNLNIIVSSLFPESNNKHDGQGKEYRWCNHEPTAEHLAVDLVHVNPDFLSDMRALANAMVTLVQDSPFTLLSYHCHEWNNAGISISCLGVLLEAHISLYAFPHTRRISVDLFATSGSTSLLAFLPSIRSLFGHSMKSEDLTPSAMLTGANQSIAEPIVRCIHTKRGFRRPLLVAYDYYNIRDDSAGKNPASSGTSESISMF